MHPRRLSRLVLLALLVGFVSLAFPGCRKPTNRQQPEATQPDPTPSPETVSRFKSTQHKVKVRRK